VSSLGLRWQAVVETTAMDPVTDQATAAAMDQAMVAAMDQAMDQVTAVAMDQAMATGQTYRKAEH
jgi:hypothetical protein